MVNGPCFPLYAIRYTLYAILMWLSTDTIIQSGGLLAIGLIIFAESGLLFGFIFPGDTLLLAAGFFAGQGRLPIVWLILVTIVAAVIGDNIGYRIGWRLGPKLFKRQDGILFRREYIARTQDFYEKHGGLTIVAARFIAYIRTFAPVIAGVGKMPWQRFAFYNVIGGILWGISLPLIGYFIGYSFPGIDKYFIWFLIISAHILIAIVLIKILKDPKTRYQLAKMMKEEFRYYFSKK